MLEIGKSLGERYKILSKLGSGGMSTVYLAQDLILEREVAVKVLRFDFHQSPDALRRFQREALSATQLTHPNIVAVYDVGEENGSNYIVMEYVKGKDLKTYIEEKGPISPKESVHIMRQILSAIDVAHRNRIIHRDIKPQNVLIDEFGTVKITDFGIAIALSETSLTQTNTLLGSVHYLSPEQARGGMATMRSDIYALGIVLFELLIGHVPFDGESAVSIALKHFQDPLPAIHKIMPTVPQSLENVVLKATAKDPLDRYESCAEMFEDLNSSLHPNRLNEPRFKPSTFTGETKVLKPVVSRPPIKKIHPHYEEVVSLPKMDKHHQDLEIHKKKKRSKWPILLGLLLTVLTIGLAYYFLFYTAPNDVVVPDVLNKTEEEAKIILADAKLSIKEVKQEPSEEVEAGKILEVQPKVGSSVKEGSSLVVKISTGTEKVKLEDYKGKTYEVIRDELKKLGFTVEKQEEYHETIEEGKIVGQSIAEGQEVLAKKTVLVLTVSKGKGPITLRDLSEYSRAAIQDYAKQNELSVSFTEQDSESVESGKVISQKPAAGTQIKKGDALTIVLSKGKGERIVKKQVTIPYLAPIGNHEGQAPQNASNTIEVYIEDAVFTYKSLYQTFKITENKDIELSFTLTSSINTGKYKILRDGEVIEEGYAQ